MKAIDINTTSWHYRLAYWSAVSHGPMTSWDFRELDFCAYIRAVIGGVFKAIYVFTLAIVVFGGLLAMCVFVIYHMYRLIALRMVDEPVLFSALLVIAVLVGALAGLTSTRREKERWERTMSGEAAPKRQPGFLSAAYSSWKGKYCTRVNFVRPATEEELL